VSKIFIEVMTRTSSSQAAEIVEVLARGAKGDAEATTRGGTKAARKTDDEDYLPKQR
jgi:hypothetical protein